MNGLFHTHFPIVSLQNLVCILYLWLISVLTGHISSAYNHTELVASTSDRAGPSKESCQLCHHGWKKNMVGCE